MERTNYSEKFKKQLFKIRNKDLFEKIEKQIEKVLRNPLIGKPMKHERKGTRELYVSPYRLAYSYYNEEILFLELYHKDDQ